MPKIDPLITQEYERLVENSTMRREMLFRKGRKRAETKKIMTIISGVLALLSASAIASTLTLFIGSIGMQIVAAISAAISGIISLIISSFYNDLEMAKMLTGASKYLSLRERTYNVYINPSTSTKQAYEQLSVFKDEYTNLDMEYSQYLPKVYNPSCLPPRRFMKGKENTNFIMECNKSPSFEELKLLQKAEKK
jgi:hypothetical protein